MRYLRILKDDPDEYTEYESPFKIPSPKNFRNQLTESFSLTQDSIMKSLLVLGGAVSACAALILLLLLLKLMCRCACLKGPCNQLKNMLMFNSILRYFMMTYLANTVGCARQLRRVSDHESEMISYESLLSLFTMLIMIVLPLILMCFLWRNQEKLKDQNFVQKYGTTYALCAVDRGRWPLIFIAVFCFRRFMVSISVGLFVDN